MFGFLRTALCINFKYQRINQNLRCFGISTPRAVYDYFLHDKPVAQANQSEGSSISYANKLEFSVSMAKMTLFDTHEIHLLVMKHTRGKFLKHNSDIHSPESKIGIIKLLL